MDIWIKNTDTIEHSWSGQGILTDEYYLIEDVELNKWQANSQLLIDIANGIAVVARDNSGSADIADVNEAINYLKDIKSAVQHTISEALSSNALTLENKVLYTKIHGQKAMVAAGQMQVFEMQIPYTEVYFQGAEVMVDIIGVTDFHIFHPVTQTSIEQYGYAVNMGTIKYIRESKYAARIPQGLIIRCEYTNDTTGDLEVGVNFILHEIRDNV